MSKSSSSRAKGKTAMRASTAQSKNKKTNAAKPVKTVVQAVEEAEKPVKTKFVPDLRRWNIWLAAVFVIQAAAILLLSKAHDVSVTTNYLAVDPLAPGHTLVPAVRHLFDLNVGFLVTLFLLSVGVAHVVAASVYRKFYEAELAQGINRIRWLESAITSTVMFLTVALLGGVHDVSTLLMLMALTFIVHALASCIELRNKGKAKVDWTTARVAMLAGVLPYVVLGIYVFSTSVYGATHLPGYVYGLFATMVAACGAYLANYVLQRLGRGRWGEYLFGERMYMVISLAANTAVAWQIYAGLLHP